MRLLAEIALITLAAIGVAVCVILIPRRGLGALPRSVRSPPRPDQLAQARAPCQLRRSQHASHARLPAAGADGDRDAEAGSARLCAGRRSRPTPAASCSASRSGSWYAPGARFRRTGMRRESPGIRSTRCSTCSRRCESSARAKGARSGGAHRCRPRGRARRRAPRAGDPDPAVRAAARRRSLAGRRTSPVSTVGARPDQGARRSTGPGRVLELRNDGERSVALELEISTTEHLILEPSGPLLLRVAAGSQERIELIDQRRALGRSTGRPSGSAGARPAWPGRLERPHRVALATARVPASAAAARTGGATADAAVPRHARRACPG